jgi:DNA modification methylase
VKPTRRERDAGLHHLPAKTAGEATDREDGSAGLNSPRAGAGRTSGARNHHPTVKPIELMRYLCRLVTPPGGLVLDPFAGSGTTGIAALQEGLRFVGIDLDAEYARIAMARIEGDAPLFNRVRRTAGQTALALDAPAKEQA